MRDETRLRVLALSAALLLLTSSRAAAQQCVALPESGGVHTVAAAEPLANLAIAMLVPLPNCSGANTPVCEAAFDNYYAAAGTYDAIVEWAIRDNPDCRMCDLSGVVPLLNSLVTAANLFNARGRNVSLSYRDHQTLVIGPNNDLPLCADVGGPGPGILKLLAGAWSKVWSALAGGDTAAAAGARDCRWSRPPGRVVSCECSVPVRKGSAARVRSPYMDESICLERVGPKPPPQRLTRPGPAGRGRRSRTE